MTENTIVDVGIPTHGTPAHLREAVESVVGQSFRDWRLTVSENGAGGDAIAAVLEPHLSDPRVRHVVVGQDITPGENHTRALRSGSAPFVAVLHDDDRWDADFLARRVAFLEQHATAGIVFANARFIDSNGRELARTTPRFEEGVQDREAFLRALYLRNVIPVQTVLGRRSAYDEVGSAFSAILFSDHEMWMRIAALFDVGFLDVYDSDYRIHQGQATNMAFTQLGAHRLEFYESVDQWVPACITSRDRKRAHASAHFRVALEARERRERRRAVASFWSGLREYPAAPLDGELRSLAIGAMRTRSRLRKAWSELAATGLKSALLGLS
jgi:hypothetical protein